MDSVKYEVIREEYTLLDWVAAIGGLGSILLGVAQTLHQLESPHYFVTAAMAA